MQVDDELNALDDDLNELEAQQLRLEWTKTRVGALETRLRALEGHEIKTLTFDVKQLTEAGEFEGLAAIYGVRDAQNDVVERGAFASVLQAGGGRVPILWSHNQNEVLGVGELEDTPAGLKIRGRLNLAVARAVEVYALLKQRAVRGLSIGFDTVRAVMKGTTRHILEIRLWEISITPFPAQTAAVITGVKSQGPEADEATMAAIVQILAETRAWLRQRW